MKTNRIKYLWPLLAAAVLASSCGKKTDNQALDKNKKMLLSSFTQESSVPPHPVPLPKGQKVVVPDAVKAKYHTVTMAVGNRVTKAAKEFKVSIGGGAKVPDSPYSIKVMAYLPQWVFHGDVVTSKGVEPVDPAVRAIITKGGKPVFDGFIFQRHKTPSFVTDKYAITLMGAS
ncbi:MAG: hypothetical protein ACYDFU_02050 [Nitrospirota bacterium]